MDLIRIIHELQQERAKLDVIIRSLEQLEGENPEKPVRAAGRRGRRFMDVQGRLEVSQRMKKYWEERRKQQQASGAAEANSKAPGSAAFSA